MSSKGNIIVLAGTTWQIPLVKKIKEEGYSPIVFNLLQDSPAFQYADDYRIVDILDYEICLKNAKEYTPQAIMSDECDIATPTIAYLSSQLGLNSIGMEMAELYTNKYKMRLFGEKHHLATPKFLKCYTVEEAIGFYQKIGKKMIIKPMDSNSSRGVYTINSERDIHKCFDKSLAFSRVERCVILEEYIEGTEFTVDGIKTDKGHVSLAISEKRHYSYNENIACSLYFSYDNSNYDYDELRRVNDLFVELSGLPFGLTHAEYKYSDGKFYLIEIGARGGGNLISAKIVPVLSGVDNYNYLINKTLGQETEEDITISDKYKSRCAILQFFDTAGKEGVVKEIKGEEFLKSCERIMEYSIYCEVGERVFRAADDSKRIGYYIAYGEDEQELEDTIKKINENFEIVLEEN